MTNVRKLQYIGKQYLLNIPVDLVRSSQWQKGDYIEIAKGSERYIGVRKIAENTASKTQIEIAVLEKEAIGLSGLINTGGALMGPGDYSACLSRFSHVASRARKLRQKMNVQIQ